MNIKYFLTTITSVSLCTKKGKAVNELTKYRYDVVLQTKTVTTAGTDATKGGRQQLEKFDYSALKSPEATWRPANSCPLAAVKM